MDTPSTGQSVKILTTTGKGNFIEIAPNVPFGTSLPSSDKTLTSYPGIAKAVSYTHLRAHET